MGYNFKNLTIKSKILYFRNFNDIDVNFTIEILEFKKEIKVMMNDILSN